MLPATLSCVSSSSFSRAAVAFSKSCAYTESRAVEDHSTITLHGNNIHDNLIRTGQTFNKLSHVLVTRKSPKHVKLC